MAKQLLVLEEVEAILRANSTPNRVIEAFRTQATKILAMRNERETEATTDEEPDRVDRITVSSSYGHRTQKGYVEFTLNELRTQMEPKKAREVGLMLLEAAEAATSDEIFVTLLKEKVGIDTERAGMVLIDLRELRQGTREISWPS
jgi:hypothetical protein